MSGFFRKQDTDWSFDGVVLKTICPKLAVISKLVNFLINYHWISRAFAMESEIELLIFRKPQ